MHGVSTDRDTGEWSKEEKEERPRKETEEAEREQR